MLTIDGQYYGQDNPRDQIRLISGSIRGWLSNLDEGITDSRRAVEKIEADLARLEKIIMHVDRLDTWEHAKD